MASGKPYGDRSPRRAAPNRLIRRQETTAFSPSEESKSASRPEIGRGHQLCISGTAPRGSPTRLPPTPPPARFSSPGGDRLPVRTSFRRPIAPAFLEFIEKHRPWDMVDNMVLIIIDQTYTAALEVPDRREVGNGKVEVKCAVVAGDPDSPVLTLQASARHCCIAFNNPRGDAAPYQKYTCPKQKMRPCHRLARTCISVSSGALHMSRVGGGDPKDYWACADVRPDVAAGGALAILDTIILRLDAVIKVEKNLVLEALASLCEGPKVEEIIEAYRALDAMRSEMDLPALMRRRLRKRRNVVRGGEATCRPATVTDQDEADQTDTLVKKLRTIGFS